MTRGRKLFAAAALVAGGLGVAKLLGEPAPPLAAVPSAGVTVPQTVRSREGAPSDTVPRASGAVRLVPDFAAANSNRGTSLPLIDAAPPLWNASTGPPPDVTRPAEWSGDGEAYQPGRLAPRAKLRNEAPRALAIDAPLAPAAQPATTPVAAREHNSLAAPRFDSWSAAHAAAPAAPAAFEQAANAAPTIVAPPNGLTQPPALTPIAPPPWPMPDDESQPRRHVVVDGDSLARLAGRYLDDSRRGHEIFEANRGVLNDPEILPLGVELVIPDRTAATPNPQSPQSFAPRAVAIYASPGGLVPVRPVPAASGFAPRALLDRPMPAE